MQLPPFLNMTKKWHELAMQGSKRSDLLIDLLTARGEK
jgi:hypothetical protein